MMLALAGLGIASLLELLLWTPPVWRIRRAAARILIVLIILASAGLLVERLAAWTIMIAVFSLYRCVNLRRVAADRTQPDYLYHVSVKTALWLIGAQVAAAGLAGLDRRYDIDPISWWYVLAAVQLACALILLVSTFRHLRTTKKPAGLQLLPDSELPSLTVAIPARNETADLEACLQSLVASTYPKLEIVVLDDCSQNKRTPEIIRGFAHSGVQFIAGTPPPDDWLAKNHAYAQLAEAANGELLLFCGVDTRFEPRSLTVLVSAQLQKKKVMLSVLPKNRPPVSWNVRSWLVQPSRYAWELSLPRRLLRRPPVLSTCWLISREALRTAGGFQAVKRKGVPESYLARAAASSNDGYSFLQSDRDIGVASEKSFDEQKATAVRTRYLQLHRRPELTAFVGLAELATLIWPLFLAVTAALGGQWALAGIAGAGFLLCMVAYDKIVNLTYRRFTLRGMWLMPLAAVYDIGLLNYSMWQYEFGEVLWKGRNVCLPVMRVTADLE